MASLASYQNRSPARRKVLEERSGLDAAGLRRCFALFATLEICW